MNGRESNSAGRDARFALTPATLNVEGVLASAHPSVVERGRAYYRQAAWRLRVERLGPQEAIIRVQGSERYRVQVWLEDEDGVMLICNCPFADNDMDVVCKHGVAAMLFLRDYLRANAPPTWEDVLAKVVRPATTRAAQETANELLFFSLQQRGSWAIVPYTLATRLFPVTAWNDRDEAARIIKKEQLSVQAEKASSYGTNHNPRAYLNVTRQQASLVKLLISSGMYYGQMYGGSSLTLDTMFTLLGDAPLFFGTDKNPFQRALTIIHDAARIEMEMTTNGDGLNLRPVAVLPDERVFTLNGRALKIVSYQPLWTLADDCLFHLDAAHDVFTLFQEGSAISVPRGEEAVFLEKYVTTLAERFPLRGEAVKWEDLKDVAPVPRLYLTEEESELRAQLRFAYGDYEVAAARHAPFESVRRNAETGALVRIARQPELEAERFDEVSAQNFGLKRRATHAPDTFALRSKVHPFDFLLRHVPQLAAAGYEIYGEEELTQARVNRNRPSISFNVTSGIDWFDVKAVVNFGELEVSLAEIRRSVRKRERFIRLADGTVGEIPPEWVERYRHLFALSEETEQGVRVAHHHLTLLDQLLADDQRAVTDQEFKRRRNNLQNFKGIKEQKLPKHFTGELRPYQKAGFDWLHFLREYKFGGCLADDMGTGKTIQTLAFLQSLKERGVSKKASLLVLPRSLLFNWEREAVRFTPKLRLLNHAMAERTSDITDFDDYDVVLTTYGVLLRDIEMLMHYEFNYLILDEAQAIKNPLAETAKAARLLRGEHRLTLTGTPVENNTLELWSQFAFLNPGLLGNAEYFRTEFATPIERKGDEAAAQFLRKMVYPFILRRTKDQVAKDLPPRTTRQMVCEMEPPQRKLYDERRDYYRALLLKMIEEEGINNARFKVLEGLLRLRQICNHPRLVVPSYKGASAKFELLMETLATLHAEGHKALVFSQFVKMLKLVETELKKRKIPFAYLDGKTRDRQERVDEFQENAAIPFFLISLKAGGVGLNLTAADYVIHVDPWWNPAVEMQATDRTHRIGQEKPVFVYKLIVRDSVEEKILQLQERKRQLVTQLISTESGFFKSLTPDDIKTLFS